MTTQAGSTFDLERPVPLPARLARGAAVLAGAALTALARGAVPIDGCPAPASHALSIDSLPPPSGAPPRGSAREHA